MAVISQREARRLRRRVEYLEDVLSKERRVWGPEFRFGTEISRAKWEALESVPVSIRTARKLKHAVIAVADDDGLVRFHALPLAEVKP